MLLRGNFYSNTLGMDTGLTLLVPDSPMADGAYGAAYLLHGLCGDQHNWTDNTLLPVYGRKTHTVFIMPEAGRSFYTDLRFGPRYFTYVLDELPKICGQLLKLSQRREHTAVIGGSMGGYGALKCALTRPEQYGICCAMSSACLFLEEDLAFQKSHGHGKRFDFKTLYGGELICGPEDDLSLLAARTAENPRKPRIYLSCGKSDPYHKESLRFREHLEALGYQPAYEEWEGVHDWDFFNEALRRSMRYLP